MGPKLARATLCCALLPTPARAAERAPAPSLHEVLERAGRQVVRLESELALVVAEEHYEQKLIPEGDSVVRRRKALVSDVLWRPTGDSLVWAFFRDVKSEDGVSVADRDVSLRLLFSSASPGDACQIAMEILESNARFNIGRRERTVNIPTLGLSLLHPRNRPRFQWRKHGERTEQGRRLWVVDFDEVARPTVVRSPGRADYPCRGSAWLDPDSGAVARTAVELDEGRGAIPTSLTVSYHREPRLDSWLPFEMKEKYGTPSRIRLRQPGVISGELVEATARYSRYRKAEVELDGIRPIRQP